jgi:hypothetical protein
MAPLFPGSIDNGENCSLEERRKISPCVDYLRQVASILALNLCAYLCIGPFTILCSMFIFSGLRILCGEFESLRSLQF